MRRRRRTSAVLPLGTATGVVHIAVRTVSLERLAAATALMARTEAVVSSSRLPDGEVWPLPRHGRLAFDSRQLRPNQRTVNGTLIRSGFVLFLFLVIALRLRRHRFLGAFDVLRLRSRLNSFFGNFFVLGDRHADVFRLMMIVNDSLGCDGGDRRQDTRSLGFFSL